MVEKGIRRGICHAIHWYEKANNKHIKDYNENKKSPYLNIDDGDDDDLWWWIVFMVSLTDEVV